MNETIIVEIHLSYVLSVAYELNVDFVGTHSYIYDTQIEYLFNYSPNIMKNIEDIISQREDTVFNVKYAIKGYPNPVVLNGFLIDDVLCRYSTKDKQMLALLITQGINPVIEVERAYCYYTKDFSYIYKNNIPKCDCKICSNAREFVNKISETKKSLDFGN